MQYLNVQDERIESVCLRADRLIGNVTSRNLFTGYGLFYKKEFMFALWLNGKFYLQAKTRTTINAFRLFAFYHERSQSQVCSRRLLPIVF